MTKIKKKKKKRGYQNNDKYNYAKGVVKNKHKEIMESLKS